ncbi:hypothetical protein FF2_039601 [Malus domestica]
MYSEKPQPIDFYEEEGSRDMMMFKRGTLPIPISSSSSIAAAAADADGGQQRGGPRIEGMIHQEKYVLKKDSPCMPD